MTMGRRDAMGFGGMALVLLGVMTFLMMQMPRGADAIPENEQVALVELFASTNGSEWKNSTGWNTTADPCTWFGISCAGGDNDTTNYVFAIDLQKNGLHGNITDAIGNFTFMESLNLSNNKIEQIADNIAELTALLSLDLSDNKLTALPMDFGGAAGITQLYLDYNDLTTLPDSIGSLSNLTLLTVKSNKLTSLPETFPALVSLQSLDLSENKLTSVTDLSQMVNLTTLVLHKNSFTSVPVFNLDSLQTLDLSNNNITVVPDLSAFSGLVSLNLASNAINNISDTFGSLPNLQNLDISDNDLKSFPSSIGSLTKLKALQIGHNKFEKFPVPSTLQATLTSLDCSSSRLDGNFPAILYNFTALVYLDLSDNQLSGTLKNTPGLFPVLETLDLSKNGFTGLMPQWFVNITELDLKNNHFCCPLPSGLKKEQTCVKLPKIKDLEPSCIPTDVDGDVNVTISGKNFEDSDQLVCKFGSNSPVPAVYESSEKISCLLKKSDIRKSKEGDELSVAVANYGADFSNTSSISIKDSCGSDNPSSSSDGGHHDDDVGSLPGWAVALTVLMVLAFTATIGMVGFYYYVRWRRTHHPSYRGLLGSDHHENL